MTRCGETILRTKFTVQQHRQSTSAVCVFTCVFVWLFLGLCGGRRVSCHSIHAATANNWVTESKKRPTHFSLPFYNACCSALPGQEENLNAWMMSYPVPWLHGFQGSPAQKAKKPISLAIRFPAWLWVWFKLSHPGVCNPAVHSQERSSYVAFCLQPVIKTAG